jgi:hypothetical protein
MNQTEPFFFNFSYFFQVKSCLFTQGPTSVWDPPTYGLPHNWDQRHMPPHLAYWLRWGHTNFLQVLTWNPILLIASSWVATIIGMNHSTQLHFKILIFSWVLVAHNCNPRNLGCRDQEDNSLKPTRANSSRDPISKLLNTKKGWQVAQSVDCLHNKRKALHSGKKKSLSY